MASSASPLVSSSSALSPTGGQEHKQKIFLKRRKLNRQGFRLEALEAVGEPFEVQIKKEGHMVGVTICNMWTAGPHPFMKNGFVAVLHVAQGAKESDLKYIEHGDIVLAVDDKRIDEPIADEVANLICKSESSTIVLKLQHLRTEGSNRPLSVPVKPFVLNGLPEMCFVAHKSFAPNGTLYPSLNVAVEFLQKKDSAATFSLRAISKCIKRTQDDIHGWYFSKRKIRFVRAREEYFLVRHQEEKFDDFKAVNAFSALSYVKRHDPGVQIRLVDILEGEVSSSEKQPWYFRRCNMPIIVSVASVDGKIDRKVFADTKEASAGLEGMKIRKTPEEIYELAHAYATHPRLRLPRNALKVRWATLSDPEMKLTGREDSSLDFTPNSFSFERKVHSEGSKKLMKARKALIGPEMAGDISRRMRSIVTAERVMPAVPRRLRDESASTTVNGQRGNMTKNVGMQESRGSAFHLPVRNRFAQRLIDAVTHDEGVAKKSTMTDENSWGPNVAAGEGAAKMGTNHNSHDVIDLAKTGTSEKTSAQALGDPKVLEHRVALMERERIPMTAMRALVMDFLMP